MGGVDIEQVAQQNPDQLLKLALPLNGRLLSYHILRIVKFMGWSSSLAAQGEKIIRGLVRAFIDTDATLAEINPLVETKEGELLALDAKLSIDDNALFRQPEIKNFFDPTQISPKEALAQKYDLAYVALDGDIGCMVNGAGLAMATMDIIEYYGGRPANFLDVGGGATADKVAEGFKIILQDGSVKAILINIFGGIMDCQTLASGIISAASTLHIQVPMIVRMEGTNVDRGKKLLKESGLPITIAKDLKDAAQKVIQAANHGNISK
jgi:succinyl-CoA synthetase beta subunit